MYRFSTNKSNLRFPRNGQVLFPGFPHAVSHELDSIKFGWKESIWARIMEVILLAV